jgi:primosomal protein N' (replication factor Y) (superfamily II helicase)
MAEIKRYVNVAVPLPIRKLFCYEVPEEWQGSLAPGKRVLVPFGKRLLPAYVLELPAKPPAEKNILPVRMVFEDEFSLPEKFLRFLDWVSRYYLQPIGEVIKTALPSGMQIKNEVSYELTDKGREGLESYPPGSLFRKILLSLKRRQGKGAISHSLGKNSSPSLSEVIARMADEGLIVREGNAFAQKVKEKTITCLRHMQSKEQIALTPRQKEALDIICEAGESTLSEFKAKFKGSHSILLKLIAFGLVETFQKDTFRHPSWEGIEDWIDGPPTVLNEDQKKSLEEISRALSSRKFAPFLLHGVTGSGKTEVYLRAIEAAVSQGSHAILLVPEIALTAQSVAYFQSRISFPMAILHSGLSPGERYDEWRRVKRGLVKLVIGARSAIFAPLDRLGLVIVDEEHDPSYKQEEKLRYHARDLSLVRGKMENAVVVLGSATPSMESYRNAMEKKFQYLSLPRRIDDRPLPEIQVVDMRLESGKEKERPIFSRALEEALHQNAERGEQALLFLNRRGFSSFSLCRDCGYVYQCPNCSVSLNYHLTDKSFRCHYCDFSLQALERCPKCSSLRLQLFGVGTQRLEEELKRKLPHIPVGRMDRDTMTRSSLYQKILGRVRRGELNLLIGTQMITKGHDLPRVTLVGVLAADLSLNIPDFRAGERTFQLLTQVAGRSGRGALPGKVIIQTYNPLHYSIQMAKTQDFGPFYQQEAQFRKEMDYPPFTRLVNLRVEGNSESRVNQRTEELGKIAARLCKDKRYSGQIEVLGPASAPLSRLKGKHRCQMLLKGRNWNLLHELTERIVEKMERDHLLPGVKLIVDVDPVNML